MYKALAEAIKHLHKWAVKKLAIHCVVSDRLSMLPGNRNPTRQRGKIKHRIWWSWLHYRRRLLPSPVSKCVDNIRHRGQWLPAADTGDRYLYFERELTRAERVSPHPCENPRLHKEIHKRAKLLLGRRGLNLTPKRRNGSPGWYRRREKRMKLMADNMAARREPEHVKTA